MNTLTRYQMIVVILLLVIALLVTLVIALLHPMITTYDEFYSRYHCILFRSVYRSFCYAYGI